SEGVRSDGAQRIEIGHEWIGLNRIRRKATQICPDIGRKRRRRQTTIPKGTEIFEVGENSQIFVADIPIERTIKIFANGFGDCWSQLPEVKQEAVARNRIRIVASWVRTARISLSSGILGGC